MKNRWVITLVTALILIGLGRLARAAGDAKVMVLSAQGPGTVSKAGTTLPLRTGLVVTVGSTIDVADKTKVSLLVLPGGSRQEATGKCVLEVTPEGLKAKTGTLTAAAASGVALVPTGKNMRHMGGSNVRDDRWADFQESPFKNFKIEPVAGAARPTLRVSFDSSQDAPLNVTIYSPPSWNHQHLALTAAGNVSLTHDPEDEGTDQIGTVSQVQPQKAGAGFHYSADVALSQALNGTARLELVKGRQTLLMTRFRVLDAQEQKALDGAVAQLQAWAAKEPTNADPYVMLMALYDDYDQLEPALQSCLKALQLRPKDAGLHEEASRFYLDLGQRAKAEQYFRQSLAKN